MARACGSYPQCPRFKSRCRYQTPKDGTCRLLGNPLRWGDARPAWAARPGGQAAKTPPFHGGNTGSIPVRVTIWRHSSAGRALASHARGHRFEFCCLHQKTPRATTVLGVFVTPKHSEPDILASRRHRALRSRPISVILTLEAPDVPHETGARV